MKVRKTRAHRKSTAGLEIEFARRRRAIPPHLLLVGGLDDVGADLGRGSWGRDLVGIVRRRSSARAARASSRSRWPGRNRLQIGVEVTVVERGRISRTLDIKVIRYQGHWEKIGGKKQGRRRSMPSTTLPAPEIKIGSRLPVTLSLPRICPAKCEPVHKWRGKT